MILDVADMRDIKNDSIDLVNATELFEHVEKPIGGLEEVYRVLKMKEVVLISMPFLTPIHGDPNDFQRWTEYKWRLELKKLGFTIEKFETMGGYFTVLGEMYRWLTKWMPVRPFRWILKTFYPLLDIIILLDRLRIIKNSKLSNYTTGYFIICRK